MSSNSLSEEKRKLKVIRKCFVELVRNMNPIDVKDHLYAKRMLTSDELDRLGLPIMTTRDKNTLILMKLESNGSGAFDAFVDTLQATSEENPAHAELVELLVSEANNA